MHITLADALGSGPIKMALFVPCESLKVEADKTALSSQHWLLQLS